MSVSKPGDDWSSLEEASEMWRVVPRRKDKLHVAQDVEHVPTTRQMAIIADKEYGEAKFVSFHKTVAFRTTPRKLTGRKTVPRRLFIESEVVDCPTDRLVL